VTGVNPNPPDLETDAVLDALIRQTPGDAEIPLPPPSVLTAYLRGEAQPEEVQMVRQALANSREFREDVLYLAGLYDQTIQERFDRTPVPAPPDVAGRPAGGSARRWPSRFGVRGRGWRLPLGVGAIALAAGLGLIVLVRDSPPGTDRGIPTGALSREQFIRDTSRGSDAPAITERLDARSAAILAFTEALRFHDGDWEGAIVSPDLPPVPGDPSWRLGGERIGTSLPSGAASPELWILALPSLELRRYAETSAGEPSRIAAPSGDRRFWTITYRMDGDFAATPPREIPR
jgi:hypothetical protein